MFGQLGDMLKMRAQAKKLQDELEKEELTGTALGGKISVIINGTNKVLRVTIDDSLFTTENKSLLENGLVEASNSAQAKIQKRMLEKVQSGQISL